MEGNRPERRNRKPLWAHPWKFKESVIVLLVILAAGIALEVLFRGRHLRPVPMPYNIYLAFIYVSLLVFFYFRYKDKAVVKWLCGIPGALSAIILLAALVLCFGILPQETTNKSLIIKIIGISHVKTSWLFLFSQLFLTTSLGMVVLKRVLPLNIKSIGFFLNHFGLFLTLLAAIVGSGDMKRLRINLLQEGNESSIGVSGQGNMYKLPFSLKLLDFKLDEYNPRLAIIDPHTGQLNADNKTFPMVEKGLKVHMNSWKITVQNYLPLAMIIDSTVQTSTVTGSCPAVFVTAVHVVKKDTMKGWILGGSYMQEPVYLPLDTTHSLALTRPEPKKYSSLLVVRTDSTTLDTVTLMVNKPYHVKGWTIYQVGFDQSKGQWSSLSVLEAVSDPWLPLVYTGFFMLMAGSLLLFWTGKPKRGEG